MKRLVTALTGTTISLQIDGIIWNFRGSTYKDMKCSIFHEGKLTDMFNEEQGCDTRIPLVTFIIIPAKC